MKIDSIDFTHQIAIPNENVRKGQGTSSVSTTRHPKLEMVESMYGIQLSAYGHTSLVPWAHVSTVYYAPEPTKAKK